MGLLFLSTIDCCLLQNIWIVPPSKAFSFVFHWHRKHNIRKRNQTKSTSAPLLTCIQNARWWCSHTIIKNSSFSWNLASGRETGYQKSCLDGRKQNNTCTAAPIRKGTALTSCRIPFHITSNQIIPGMHHISMVYIYTYVHPKKRTTKTTYVHERRAKRKETERKGNRRKRKGRNVYHTGCWVHVRMTHVQPGTNGTQASRQSIRARQGGMLSRGQSRYVWNSLKHRAHLFAFFFGCSSRKSRDNSTAIYKACRSYHVIISCLL